jgi:hypothetical protein
VHNCLRCVYIFVATVVACKMPPSKDYVNIKVYVVSKAIRVLRAEHRLTQLQDVLIFHTISKLPSFVVWIFIGTDPGLAFRCAFRRIQLLWRFWENVCRSVASGRHISRGENITEFLISSWNIFTCLFLKRFNFLFVYLFMYFGKILVFFCLKPVVEHN